MKTVVVGGGAAGFFLAINLKERMPQMDVTICEQADHVLRKVEVSGGGRCNCTNTFEGVKDLSAVYPRGHRLMKRLFRQFDYRDAYAWFENHGVPLTVQDDHCVFPASQDAHSIIDCFTGACRRLGVHIRTGCKIGSLDALTGYDFVAVTTGGQSRAAGLQWLADMGHDIVAPVPSLFTLQIDDPALTRLMGLVVEEAAVMMPGTRFRASGPLLITHWGMSGPAILRLSSYAARHLHDCGYRCPLAVNWLGLNENDAAAQLADFIAQYPQKQVDTMPPFPLPGRLWEYLTHKSIGQKAQRRWTETGRKERNQLVNALCNDTYDVSGKGAFKEEFVTCGGVALTSVNPNTMESRVCPHLYFAGEVLDIDGVTGGFNFQAAWTTAYTAATAIADAGKI